MKKITLFLVGPKGMLPILSNKYCLQFFIDITYDVSRTLMPIKTFNISENKSKISAFIKMGDEDENSFAFILNYLRI